MDWGTGLFILKWILLGLVYLFLGLIFLGITREIRQQLPQSSHQSSIISYGRLKVSQSGSDPKLQQGTILILQPETRLGTKKGNTIILGDQYISGNHARLFWDGISWWVEDMNSTNGTYVNRKRISPGLPEPLPFGVSLQLGDMVFEMME